jgi:hypothetical protein
MIPVEMLVRTAVTGVSNAYCLVFFACCREVKKLSKFEIEKLAREKLTKAELEELSKEEDKSNLVLMRGKDVIESKLIGNFIFSFGCQPSFGVGAESKYINDLKNLFSSNFDLSGCIVLPDVFSKVLSSDAKFETVSSNLSRKLKL